MWLKSKEVGVLFDEKRGGMPMEDSLGLLRCASIELALQRTPIFFQSRNDPNPRIKRHDSGLTASGIMRKTGKVLEHTYELKAKLEHNELYLDFKLNVPTTERIVKSKVWFLTRWFDKCIVDGKHIEIGERLPNWTIIVDRMPKQPKSVILCKGKDSIEIQGSTEPSASWSLYKYSPPSKITPWSYDKLEIIYEWAEKNIEKGTYRGSFKIIYGV